MGMIRPKVNGFKFCLEDGFLRAINIRSTPCFGGEVKGAPCCMIFQYVKSLASTKKYIARPN
jgi:hypothetical protein